MRIAGLVRTSTVDYPGLIAAVLFAPSCNLDCFYCHNRLLLDPEVPLLDPADVMAFFQRRAGLLDAVVLSGGEPLLQPGLASLVTDLRRLGYRIKLDTNGTRPILVRDLIRRGLLDYVAVDYKAPWRRYPEICGCTYADAAAVQQTFALLAESPVPWEARTTVPTSLGLPDLTEMARAVQPFPAWFLQVCLKPAVYKDEDAFRLESVSYAPASLQAMAEAVRADQPHVAVRA